MQEGHGLPAEVERNQQPTQLGEDIAMSTYRKPVPAVPNHARYHNPRRTLPHAQHARNPAGSKLLRKFAKVRSRERMTYGEALAYYTSLDQPKYRQGSDPKRYRDALHAVVAAAQEERERRGREYDLATTPERVKDPRPGGTDARARGLDSTAGSPNGEAPAPEAVTCQEDGAPPTSAREEGRGKASAVDVGQLAPVTRPAFEYSPPIESTCVHGKTIGPCQLCSDSIQREQREAGRY